MTAMGRKRTFAGEIFSSSRQSAQTVPVATVMVIPWDVLLESLINRGSGRIHAAPIVSYILIAELVG